MDRLIASITCSLRACSLRLYPQTVVISQFRERHFQRRITGTGDRPPLPGRIMPEPNKYRYLPILPPDGRYTTKPLPIRKLGGRDPETGRVVVRTIGGGNKKMFRW